MFSTCCGCNKKSGKDKIKNAKSVQDVATQSEVEVCTVTAQTDAECSQEKRNSVPVLKQPADLNRQSSTISDVKIEISDNDDDEVFCEGVGPPIKLNENLGAPGNYGRVPLPTWFSDDQSEEIGGIQEPPATPVGKDELALRRHRFFSELLKASQNPNTHRVRFDPLGPVIAGELIGKSLERLLARFMTH